MINKKSFKIYKYLAGQDLFEGAMCVKIDNSFYLAIAGDETNRIYYAMEAIKEDEEIKLRISTGSFTAKMLSVSVKVRIGTGLLYRG